jgi:copper chaperone NosL
VNVSLPSGESRIQLEPQRPPWLDRRRWLVLALALGGVLLFALSWWLPYWSFRLVAPQYPEGLSLQIALTGITGDVSEIDILNHYIGMRPMTGAAQLESELSLYLIATLGMGIVAGILLTGKRLGWLGLLPAVALPLGFLADTTWWMYRFGHELDPHAPLTFEPFMPVLLGAGHIGQFHTTAWPAAGFWMALLATALVGLAVWMRKRVCDSCALHASCGAQCRNLFVLRQPRAAP